MKKKILIAGLTIAILCATLAGCASVEREIKSLESEFNNGLNREVIVYSATGEEISRFKGKFDIEYQDGRVLFDDENGKRHCIYFENGTVIVNEI